MTTTTTETVTAEPQSARSRAASTFPPRQRAGPSPCATASGCSRPGTAPACRSTCSRSTTAASCSGSTISKPAARCWSWSTPSIRSRGSPRCGASSARRACRSRDRVAGGGHHLHMAPWHAAFTSAKLLRRSRAHPAHRERAQADAAGALRDAVARRSVPAVPRPARRGGVPRARRRRPITRARAKGRATRASRTWGACSSS